MNAKKLKLSECLKIKIKWRDQSYMKPLQNVVVTSRLEVTTTFCHGFEAPLPSIYEKRDCLSEFV